MVHSDLPVFFLSSLPLRLSSPHPHSATILTMTQSALNYRPTNFLHGSDWESFGMSGLCVLCIKPGMLAGLQCKVPGKDFTILPVIKKQLY